MRPSSLNFVTLSTLATTDSVAAHGGALMSLHELDPLVRLLCEFAGNPNSDFLVLSNILVVINFIANMPGKRVAHFLGDQLDRTCCQITYHGQGAFGRVRSSGWPS